MIIKEEISSLIKTEEVRYLEERVEDLEKITSEQNDKIDILEKKSQELEENIDLQKHSIESLKEEVSNLKNKLNVKKLGIVGFSYEVTSGDSSAKWIIKEQIGRITSDKKWIAYGWNWSQEYENGYGYSSIYLDEKGPFYEINGGYTEYSSEDSTIPFVKSKQWGEERGVKFAIRKGFAWNPHLQQRGYSNSYFYLSENQKSSNIIGTRIQQTSENSRDNWFERHFHGKKSLNEISWADAFGWNDYGYKGNGYFSFYFE